MFGGNVLGGLYLVPNPEPDQGYASIYGEPSVARAIALPFGEKATERPDPVGRTDGGLYLVPKPEPDQG
jgi:hypothetical protein